MSLLFQPPMRQNRRNLVRAAFIKLDKTGDGVITVEDLTDVYNVQKHPKFLSGEMTKEDILRGFLDSFDTPHDKDGVVRAAFLRFLDEIQQHLVFGTHIKFVHECLLSTDNRGRVLELLLGCERLHRQRRILRPHDAHSLEVGR